MRKNYGLLLLVALMLTGCSNYAENEPTSVIETTNVSTEEIDTSETTTSSSAETTTTAQTTTATSLQPPTENTLALYQAYFGEHYYGDDLVCLKDVTHDGTDEMIVISTEDGYIYSGCVYTVKNKKVEKIYEKGGGTDHMGGFFNWYLVKDGSYWDLAEEYFDMWQGHGEVGFRAYSLSDSGEQNMVNHIYTPENSSDYESDGTVTQAAWDAYCKKLDSAITNAYRMYDCNSNSTATPKSIETDPAVVLGCNYPNKSTTVPMEPTTTTVTLVQTGYTTQGCNLRSSASKASDDNIIGYLPPRTTFTTDQFDGYWYHITCSVGTGYVSHKMIALGDPPKEEPLTGDVVNVTGYTTQDCNLRSSPSKDSDANIIGFMPKGTSFTADRLADNYWYHVTSSVGSGYISYKMVTIDSANSSGSDSSHADLERIAEKMYLDNAVAVVSCYTYYNWDAEFTDTNNEELVGFRKIKNISSMDGIYAELHKTFSKRYDDYNRVQTSGDPREDNAGTVSYCSESGLFKVVDGNVYVFSGECPYHLESATAVYQRTDGDEVWFKMTANDWASGPFTADFSLVKEDGVWKIGAATYPRY